MGIGSSLMCPQQSGGGSAGGVGAGGAAGGGQFGGGIGGGQSQCCFPRGSTHLQRPNWKDCSQCGSGVPAPSGQCIGSSLMCPQQGGSGSAGGVGAGGAA